MKSTYTQAIADEICELLAQGQSLVTICKADHMPTRKCVNEWRDKYPDFGISYARAREDQADYLAEEILSISDESEVYAKYQGDDVTLELSGVAVQRNRLRADSRKWYASKLNPRKYGDKTILSGDEEAPLVIKTIERTIVKPKNIE